MVSWGISEAKEVLFGQLVNVLKGSSKRAFFLQDMSDRIQKKHSPTFEFPKFYSVSVQRKSEVEKQAIKEYE